MGLQPISYSLSQGSGRGTRHELAAINDCSLSVPWGVVTADADHMNVVRRSNVTVMRNFAARGHREVTLSELGQVIGLVL